VCIYVCVCVCVCVYERERERERQRIWKEAVGGITGEFAYKN